MSTYKILDLTLPACPQNFFCARQFRELQPKLQRFAAKPAVADQARMDLAWNDFKAREQRAWETAELSEEEKKKDPVFLSPPGGQLSSKLASVKDCHLDFVDELYQIMTAKVMVLFGDENQAGYRMRWSGRFDSVWLWTQEFKDVKMWVLYTDHTKEHIERLVFPARHREHFLRATNETALASAKVQDQIFRAASLVSVIDNLRSDDERGYTLWKQQQQTSQHTDRKAKRSAEDQADVANKAKKAKSTGAAQKKSPLELNSELGDRDVIIECVDCGFRRINREARFWNKDKRFYLASRGTKCAHCSEKSAANPEGKAMLGLFIPIDRVIPYIITLVKEYEKSPAQVMTTINNRRQKYQENGESLEGRPFRWDTVPSGRPKNGWTGPITILGLEDHAGDPDAQKCTPGKSNYRKLGKDARFTGNGRRPAKPKTDAGRLHRLSYVEPSSTVLGPSGKHNVIS